MLLMHVADACLPSCCCAAAAAAVAVRYRALLLGDAAVERPGARAGALLQALLLLLLLLLLAAMRTATCRAAIDELADSSSGSEDAERPRQQQKLQQGRTGQLLAGTSARRKAAEQLEMQVTFTPGLEKLGAQLLERKKEAEARQHDSVWEAYLR